ncbi:hypothetical protein PI86_12525 [Burkholderia sp. A9]|nr:hypothetical protein PI86_12525 [Burkholderia sp. A9]
MFRAPGRCPSAIASRDGLQPTPIYVGVFYAVAGLLPSLLVVRDTRDLGYAIGALSAGLMADRFGFADAILVVAAVTFASGCVVALMMRERH